MIDAIKKAIIDALNNAYASVTDLSWVNKELAGVGDLANDAADSGIFAIMQTVGTSLLLCMFFIHLLESALKDRNDPDSLFKEIAMLGVYAIVILFLQDIIENCVSIIDGVLALSINAPLYGSEDLSQELTEYETDKLIVMVFDAVIFKIVGTIVMFVVKCVCSVVVITIKIEIVVRTVLMPLAVGFIAEDGWRGPGGRYIKKWCACFFQCVIITLASRAYGMVVYHSMGNAASGGAGSFFVAVLAGGFALVGICTKSGQLANDVMGT